MNTETKPKMVRRQDGAPKDRRALQKVRAIFGALHKYIHAKTIYTSNNPNVAKFANALYGALRAFFKDHNELVLAIEQYRILWDDEIVYENKSNTDSIAFLLFKDGVGEVTFQSSITPEELDEFTELLKTEIYTPSANIDIVGRLWQQEFRNISYRVFDEYADGASGDGRGSGAESPEEPLMANDHPIGDRSEGRSTKRPDESLEPLVTYLYRFVEDKVPSAAAIEKEEHLQFLLDSVFAVDIEELNSRLEEFQTFDDGDKLIWLVNIMLDFTQTPAKPPVARDILDIIERLVHHLAKAADIRELIALLNIQRDVENHPSPIPDFRHLPEYLKNELTDGAYLLTLARVPGRSRDDVHDLLQYYRMVGRAATSGLCELLANLNDPSMHKDACDTLLAISGDDIMPIVEGLNLDNPNEAKDAVYLIWKSGINEIPPIIKRLVSWPDIQVREHVIEYLVHVGGDEAAQLLSGLLDDPVEDVRVKTLAAVEDFNHPLIVDKVMRLCFADDSTAKSTVERERMFRTVGGLAGETALAPIDQMIKKRGWLPFGKTRDRNEKLFAISALRNISGDESLKMLTALSKDRDSLVRTKALYALKQLPRDEADDELQTVVASKEAE